MSYQFLMNTPLSYTGNRVCQLALEVFSRIRGDFSILGLERGSESALAEESDGHGEREEGADEESEMK